MTADNHPPFDGFSQLGLDEDGKIVETGETEGEGGVRWKDTAFAEFAQLLRGGEAMESIRAARSLAEAVRLPLLDGVDTLRWRLLAAGQAHTQWPAAENRSRGRGRAAIVTPLPEAVEFTLELADVGTVVRVLALR